MARRRNGQIEWRQMIEARSAVAGRSCAVLALILSLASSVVEAGIIRIERHDYLVHEAMDRLGFFDGKLLTAGDLDDEQSYKRSTDRHIGRVDGDLSAVLHMIGFADIVLLLELLVYALPGDAPGQLEAQRAPLVLDSMRDFASPDYGVDIYKLEPPAMLRGVPDPQGAEAAAVQRAYDRLGALTTRPWVLLSAAAGPADFERSLTYALRAGASGYLCGRAIWQSAFEHFPDMAAMERDLASGATRFVHGINDLTDRLATPWHRHPAWQGGVKGAGDGPAFAAQYPAA